MADAKTLNKVEEVPAWWESGPLPEPPCTRMDFPHKSKRVSAPSIIVVHCTAGSTTRGAIATMEERGVSSQIVIPDNARDGEPTKTVRLVSDTYYGYHVRNQCVFKGQDRINSRSFGVEIVHTGQEGDQYSEWQVSEMARWARYWMSRYPIRHIITHAYLDPSRRIDPTVMFPWGKFLGMVLAGYSQEKEQEQNKPVKLILEGKATEVDILIDEGSAYASVKELAALLGYTVAWNGPSKTISLTKKAGTEPPG